MYRLWDRNRFHPKNLIPGTQSPPIRVGHVGKKSAAAEEGILGAGVLPERFLRNPIGLSKVEETCQVTTGETPGGGGVESGGGGGRRRDAAAAPSKPQGVVVARPTAHVSSKAKYGH